jgi:uncharacterized protein YlaI
MISRKEKKKICKMGNEICPICNEQQILVEHHIRGRKIPNPNHPSNLAYICPNCHQKIHYGIIVLEGYFKTTSGLELFWHHYKDESFTGEKIKTHLF